MVALGVEGWKEYVIVYLLSLYPYPFEMFAFNKLQTCTAPSSRPLIQMLKQSWTQK